MSSLLLPMSSVCTPAIVRALRPASLVSLPLLPMSLVLLTLLTLPRPAFAVSSADEICAGDTDPCVISSSVSIDDGAVIDFGTRKLQINGSGTIVVGAGTATIRCGGLTTNLGASATAFNVHGPNGNGATAGGSLTLEARRACADDAAVSCLSDADCSAGTCSGGTASIQINGKILGQGEEAALVVIAAADAVEIGNNVNLNGTTAESDGGSLEVDTTVGNVRLAGTIKLESGGQGTGGDLCVLAGGDVIVTELIDADGGDLDGGTIALEAGGDVVVRNDLSLNSTSGEGFGGEVSLVAGNSVVIAGAGAGSPTTFSANGHTLGSFGGDGGTFEITAGADVTIDDNVEILSNGAAPDGFGDSIAIAAVGDVALAGRIESRAKGTQGGGGVLDVFAGGTVSVASTASIDLSGSGSGSGRLTITAMGDLGYDAAATLAASNGGPADVFSLTGRGDMTIGPNTHVVVSGTPFGDVNGHIDVDGCRITVRNGATLDNGGDFASNRFTVRERATFEAGSRVTADAFTGFNAVSYRNPDEPPAFLGTFTPAATLTLDQTLAGCPVCGNGELEAGETCDDGNALGGDGCSADCQDEGCIAATPGYPGVPLCDDGVACTVDRCDTESGSCMHVVDCDDGIACTVDVCGEDGACDNLPSDALCDDDNPCTEDSCNVAARSCMAVAVGGSCDDGLDCTSGDACNGGICIGSNNCPGGESCNENTGQCGDVTTTTLAPPGCGDGVVTPPEECDDGDNAWRVGESCQSDCGLVACADPNDSGTVTASDALFLLRAAVGSSFCEPCLCDVDASGGNPNASDALRVLRASVGITVPLACPACTP